MRFQNTETSNIAVTLNLRGLIILANIQQWIEVVKLRFDCVVNDHTIDSALLHIQMNSFQFIFRRNYREFHAALFESGCSEMNTVKIQMILLHLR